MAAKKVHRRTQLHDAVIDGDLARCQVLLSSGADANLADSEGWTALHFAAQENSTSIVSLLLEYGASTHARDSHGNTPLLRAVFASRGFGDVIRLLRGAGSDPMEQNNHGVSPLSLACTIDNYDVAQFFSDIPRS